MNASARIVEGFVRTWLENTEAGRGYVAQYGKDGAIDAIFELLNAGFLKIAAEDGVLVDLVPLDDPTPPDLRLDRDKT